MVVAFGLPLTYGRAYALAREHVAASVSDLDPPGWVNRGQQDLIEYLQEENRVLRGQLGAKRLLFTDVQRRRLAAKAKKIGRKGLFEISTLVTPDTLLRWYRRLIAKKYDGSHARRVGRPKTAIEIERLILRMARDNPRWGYAASGVKVSACGAEKAPTPATNGTNHGALAYVDPPLSELWRHERESLPRKERGDCGVSPRARAGGQGGGAGNGG